MALESKFEDDQKPDGVRALDDETLDFYRRLYGPNVVLGPATEIPMERTLPEDERINWDKCEGIEHVFYDDAGNVIFEEQLPPPQSADSPGQHKTKKPA